MLVCGWRSFRRRWHGGDQERGREKTSEVLVGGCIREGVTGREREGGNRDRVELKKIKK